MTVVVGEYLTEWISAASDNPPELKRRGRAWTLYNDPTWAESPFEKIGEADIYGPAYEPRRPITAADLGL